MTPFQYTLENRDFTTVPMPFSLYCASCQTYIRQGEPAKRFDAATFTHVVCPKTPHRNFAAHK